MDKLVILSLISLSVSHAISVPHFHTRMFFPIFRQFQIDRADVRSDQDNYAAANGNENHQAYNHNFNGAYNHFDPQEAQEDQDDTHLNSGQYDYPNYGDYNNNVHHGIDDSNRHDGQHSYVHSVPVSEHVEVTKPVAVPVYKEIGVPVPQPFKINVPHPITIGVPQPYPVAVPVSQPVPVQVIKTIAVPVEKKVPYPVEKHIPVPVEKPVPITIEKHIPVPVFKPYPIRIPVYKTIYHNIKGH